MKRGKLLSLAALLAVTLVPSVSSAQYVFAGGGAQIPIGDFKDAGAKTGWTATAGFGFDIGPRGLFVEAEGFYGSHKFEGTGDKVNTITGLGAIGYSFMPDKKVTPYVLAGAGILAAQSKPETGGSHTETEFAYTGAAGLSFTLSERLNLWVEGRLLGTKDAKMIPVTAGFTLNFGSGSM